MTARDMMLAQYAKASDVSSGGRQMPGHYGSAELHIVSVSSPVATQILHAVGIALASRIKGEDQVAVAIMGEGSSNQGDVHEALNFAAIHKLPFILSIENNGYAISVPSEKELSVKDVASRASGYGIPGVIVDGTDILACYSAGREAVERARSGGGPTLLEAKVARLTAHSSDDQQTKYRSESDLAEGLALDPLPIFRAQLRDAGVLDDAHEEALAAEISSLVDDATDYAEAEPDADPATALEHVYADPAAGEPPPPWHPAPGQPAPGHQAPGAPASESWS
jgi:2-oxoisovalerate dehydrogenase E1 component alpha subunit